MAIDAEAIVATARGWIGTPYQHQASMKGAGCDCLGLLRGVWRELRGAEPEGVPAYTPDWSEAHGRETLRDALARHLTPVAPADARAGDVVLLRMARHAPAKHCGILGRRDGALTLIHACQNRRVREEDFAPWRARMAYLFRM